MELEIYEAELADYSLQDSPFYEADTPIIFDYSMSAQRNIAAGSLGGKNHFKLSSLSASFKQNPFERIAGSGGGGFSGSDSMDSGSSRNSFNAAANSIEDAGHATDNEIINGYLAGGGVASNSSGGCNGGVLVNGGSKKKNRKCVTFLPNYVQVSNFISYLFSPYKQK